ncbi:hypothetical protein [Streptomyces acidiscabies]|uniref:hypothetical protein n=1 Tax=Streptomyces acidiscabies TaxID=42234 RepID=UPI0038F77D47
MPKVVSGMSAMTMSLAPLAGVRQAEQATKTALTFVFGTAFGEHKGEATASTAEDLAFGLRVILDGLQARLDARS